MISFFPSPYADEVLYSLLCRYHIRSGNVSYSDSIKDLYSGRYIKSVIDLPCNNFKLLSNLPYKINIDDFIEEFTLVNYYTAFLSKDIKKGIIGILAQDNVSGIHSKVAAAQNVTKYNGYIKICPKCYREEVESNGEGYLHKLHQIPEVCVCLKHKQALYKSRVPFSFMQNKFIELSSVEFVELEEADIIRKNINKFIMITEDIEYLLNNVVDNKTIEWFSNQYKEKLKQLELCTPSGVVNINEIKKRFNEFYGEEFLSMYNLDTFSEEGDNWIKYLIRNKRYVLNPIKHILFIRFLDIEIRDIFIEKIEYKPFGKGLWVCKNKICENYNKETIQTVDIHYNSHAKKPVARFKCEVCGYGYSRIGPDKNEEDKFRIGKTLEMGWVWEERLESLIRKNLSLNQIEKKLETSQKTIKKYAIKLGYIDYLNNRVKENTSGAHEVVKKKREDDKRKKILIYRRRWRRLLENNPTYTITQLRQKDIVVQDYLYRNDREWLYNHYPKKRKRSGGNSLVDWNKRDEEVLNKIKALKLDLSDINKEITISLIGNRINNKSYLLNNICRLPKTKKYINKLIDINIKNK